jgi:large subunit ribosomal protein L21
MYAIVRVGGKQYRVEKGDSIVVDRLPASEGDKLALEPLLFVDDRKAAFGPSDLDKVKVEATVAEHLKGPRIRVFKYRPKKRYRRRAGHRSMLTRIEIGDIAMGQARRAAASKSSEEKTPAAKKPAARKPAPRKPTAKTAKSKEEK